MKRIRYISSFARPMDRAAIDSIAREAERNDVRDEITGILVATGQLFFQMIEGPNEKIDALFARILDGRRHHQVMVLSTEEGDFGRICPDWAARKVDLSRATSEKFGPIRTLLHVAFVQRQLVDIRESFSRVVVKRHSGRRDSFASCGVGLSHREPDRRDESRCRIEYDASCAGNPIGLPPSPKG